jgi:hypothetical protein
MVDVAVRLEASIRVRSNSTPRGCPSPLTIPTMDSVQTLKAKVGAEKLQQVEGHADSARCSVLDRISHSRMLLEDAIGSYACWS